MIRAPRTASSVAPPSPGVEGNSRLTASTAIVLFVLLAVEGITLLSRRALLTPHVFIGALLIPPVALKIGSTSYRIARYYLGTPEYRRRGPPHWLLRVLGPAVVVLTGALIASGVALLLAPTSAQRALRGVHQASFVIWFGAMTVHVLGHLLEMVQVGSADWLGAAAAVPGARTRRALVIGCVVVGMPLGLILAAHVGPYLASRSFRFDE